MQTRSRSISRNASPQPAKGAPAPSSPHLIKESALPAPFPIPPMRERQRTRSLSSSRRQATPRLAQHDESSVSWLHLILILIVGLSVAIFPIYHVYTLLPPLSPAEYKILSRVPRSQEEMLATGRLLQRYLIGGHAATPLYFSIMAVYCVMQAFAIPGSTWLSALTAYLYNMPLALLLISVSCGIGSTVCYLLSLHVAGALVRRTLSHRLTPLRAQIQAHRSHLLSYLIFLRITPFIPNWLMNLSAPHVHVPLRVFILATVVGVLPPSLIPTSMGRTLAVWTEQGGEGEPFMHLAPYFVLVVVAALLSLAPIYLSKRN